jgi:hypothetical protein
MKPAVTMSIDSSAAMIPIVPVQREVEIERSPSVVITPYMLSSCGVASNFIETVRD